MQKTNGPDYEWSLRLCVDRLIEYARRINLIDGDTFVAYGNKYTIQVKVLEWPESQKVQ